MYVGERTKKSTRRRFSGGGGPSHDRAGRREASQGSGRYRAGDQRQSIGPLPEEYA